MSKALEWLILVLGVTALVAVLAAVVIGPPSLGVRPAAAQAGSYLWDIYLSQDPIFLKRVERAIVQSAVNVRAEAPTTTNHAARSAWAGVILNNPVSAAILMAPGFVTQAPLATTAVCTTTAGVTTCTATITDAQLQTISDSLWNDYAVP